MRVQVFASFAITSRIFERSDVTVAVGSARRYVFEGMEVPPDALAPFAALPSGAAMRRFRTAGGGVFDIAGGRGLAARFEIGRTGHRGGGGGGGW